MHFLTSVFGHHPMPLIGQPSPSEHPSGGDCHAEEELRHVKEQCICDEGMFDAQWEENHALRFRLARLELHEVLSSIAKDDNHQGQSWEESLTCKFCYGTLCHMLAYDSFSLHPELLTYNALQVFYHPTIDYHLQNVASQLSQVFPQSDCEGGLAHKLGYRGSTSWDDFNAWLHKLVEDGVELR
ncbi:uncharacterized protein EV420DRAFT_1485612 [Desarmillaria tabescens]|uniref:Uncharacterized protein n=1 Tax=Armillaria tabescens TaxID=1929756 RepID=A0AA39JGJ8_ARMTA|nr:uncharacterized protein EV420DRAFT_1485612 [Desarmillaria tabescens]KAK0441540.1 hypothetical protein EV420DRAFT_1485612 [Desarmillaria tabescens]